MDKVLWEALAPTIQAEGTCAVIKLDGNGSGDGISVLRFVQGLSQGWRGFPALPGQRGTTSPTGPIPINEVDHRPDPAQNQSRPLTS